MPQIHLSKPWDLSRSQSRVQTTNLTANTVRPNHIPMRDRGTVFCHQNRSLWCTVFQSVAIISPKLTIAGLTGHIALGGWALRTLSHTFPAPNLLRIPSPQKRILPWIDDQWGPRPNIFRLREIYRKNTMRKQNPWALIHSQRQQRHDC